MLWVIGGELREFALYKLDDKNQESRHLHWMKRVKTGNLQREHFL